MIVSQRDKDAVLAEVVKDYSAGRLPGWDERTFEDLHRFVDANEYLLPILDMYDSIEACNEVIEYLAEAFRRSYLCG